MSNLKDIFEKESIVKDIEKTHKGEIDLYYIDPPYNTGHNDFTYDVPL